MFDPCSLSLVDTVTSRALAPLPSLVELANELAYAVRGRNFSAGTDRRRQHRLKPFRVASEFQFKSFRNNFDPDARIDCVHSRDSRAQAQK